jgi:type I restriction enzyme S subunit
LDSAIERTEALIAKGRAVKTGLMNDLLTRGVLSDGSLRPSWDEAPHLYKETRLGWVPVGWELRELRMLADVSRGKFTVRPRNDPRFYGGEYPFIQTGDVALARGRILTDFGQTLNGKGLSVSKMFLVGTIMVTIAANIADTCILGVPMCAPDSLVGVTPKAGENARFIELSIRSKKRWLEGRAPQTAQRNINLEDLRPLLIASPDRTEQAAIAARYEAADSSVKSTERELLKLQLQKAGLMPDLLSGRVSVNGLTT